MKEYLKLFFLHVLLSTIDEDLNVTYLGLFFLLISIISYKNYYSLLLELCSITALILTLKNNLGIKSESIPLIN